MVAPQIIHFNRGFHYKPSILGYHYFRKPPYQRKMIQQKDLSFWMFWCRSALETLSHSSRHHGEKERNIWKAWCFCPLFLVSTNTKSMNHLHKFCKRRQFGNLCFGCCQTLGELTVISSWGTFGQYPRKQQGCGSVGNLGDETQKHRILGVAKSI